MNCRSELKAFGTTGIFDVDDRLERLSDLGDQLETSRTAVGFEIFHWRLNVALAYSTLKILVIKATNNLTEENAEFLINNRLSFIRFLGLGLADLDGIPGRLV